MPLCIVASKFYLENTMTNKTTMSIKLSKRMIEQIGAITEQWPNLPANDLLSFIGNDQDASGLQLLHDCKSIILACNGQIVRRLNVADIEMLEAANE